MRDAGPQANHSRRWFGFLFLSLMTVVKPSGAEEVVVNLAKVRGPALNLACGFLHSISPDSPADALLFPLQPKMLRMAATPGREVGGAFACYERVAALGATLQLVVSDSQQYGHAGWWPGDGGDWSRWENLVAGLVQRASAAGCDFHWDIWNEPDISVFWNPSPGDAAAAWNRFRATWSRAHNTIRRLDPDAVIVGPSNSQFRGGLFSLPDFLTFAGEEGVLPDVISWHEWTPEGILDHVEEVRSFFDKAGIPPLPISINEYVHQAHQTDPGILVWYLAALEAAKVESAAHACWNEPDRRSNCSLVTLDGILTPDAHEPRSTWWVYARYAEIPADLGDVAPGRTVNGLGGYDRRRGEARFVFGRRSDGTEPVTIRFRNLDRAETLAEGHGSVHVIAERIPDSGWDPLPHPTVTIDTTMRAMRGILTVTLPSFGSTDAYSVRLLRP